MKKIFTLLFALCCFTSMWAYTLPTGTMDLKTIKASTMGTWQDAVSYNLTDNWLVVSGYASYKSVSNQTWITYSSAGNSASTWNAIENKPFKGSAYYTTAAYTTIQSGRNLVYRVKNCKSVMVYGKNNSSSKYLKINIFEVTDGTASTSAAYTLSNTSTDEQVWEQTLDENKEYVVDIEGVGSSNSRVFEVAFERNAIEDLRKEPELRLSATEFTAFAGDTHFEEPIVYSDGGYTGSYIYSSDKPSVASVDESGNVTIGVAGKATITVSVPEDDKDFKSRSISYTITVKKVAPVGATFYESFDQFEGKGGNDDIWSDITVIPELGTFDNEGWSTEGSVLSGKQCASIRKASDTTLPSGLTTPAIGITGYGHVQFNAESWGRDGANFFVDIIGGGTFVPSDELVNGNITNEGATAKVAMNKTGEWKTFTLNFTGLTPESKFRFYAPANKRAFLDEVAIFSTPSTKISVTEVGYATYYNSAYAYTMPEGMTGYVWCDNKLQDMYEAGDAVPAGEPLVLKAEAGDYTLAFTTTEEESYKSNEMNDLEGTDKVTAVENDDNYYYYGLSLNAAKELDSVGFYWRAADGVAFTNGAHKAYLKLKKEVAGAKPAFVFGDATTGIKTVNTTATGVRKAIVNGQIRIVTENGIFTTTGAQVK